MIAAGGSGGHIFPAIALADELSEQQDAEIYFVASKRSLDQNILKGTKFKRTYFFSINPMPFSFGYKTVIFALKCAADTIRSLFILIGVKPSVVVGFGGYTSGTLVMLASCLGIKTLIHEQNVSPGRANKILDRFASRVAVSFEGTKKYFSPNKAVFTGNPLRRSMFKKEKDNVSSEGGTRKRFNILVIGGSQGAHRLNMIVRDAFSLFEKSRKDSVRVVHIAGPNDHKELAEFYGNNGIVSDTFSFMDNIHDAYRVCDLAVSRSGAASIFELAAYAKPMILVPYPNKRNSQRLNAKYFSDAGAAVYQEEDELTPLRLKNIMVSFIDDPAKLRLMGELSGKLAVKEAAGLLADEVIKLTRGKK